MSSFLFICLIVKHYFSNNTTPTHFDVLSFLENVWNFEISLV